jgi:predicted phage-related endonuclease
LCNCGGNSILPALTAANDVIRARNVTASECYALLGHHPYTNAAKIFDRLTAPYTLPQMDQSEAMAIGVYLEPYVARYAASKMGLKVRAFRNTVEYPGAVNLCATPDYMILGTNMLMEVKVSSILYGWSEDDLHPHYEYQARAQLACTNKEVCFVVALVGSAFYQIPVVRNAAKEERLLEAVDEFMHEHVLTGIRPIEEDKTQLRVVTVG